MRELQVIKSTILQESDYNSFLVESSNLEMDYSNQDIKGINSQAVVSIDTKGNAARRNIIKLFELKSPPQIDSNESLGYFYLQRHLSMIFTDVILALLLGNSLWSLQSTALSIDFSILSYLGVFCPIYFSIMKCFWQIDCIYYSLNLKHLMDMIIFYIF